MRTQARHKVKKAKKKKTTSRTQQKSSVESLDKSGLEDWFLAHDEARKHGGFPARPPEVINFLNFLWPVGVDYYSPLSPVFSGECMNLSFLNDRSVWMLRDGLVPLLWFFNANPEPGKNFKSKILVHEALEKFVPNAWRPHAGTYRMVSTQNTCKGSKTKFLLMGILMETYCSLKHLRKQLKAVQATLGKEKLANAEFLAFFPGKFDGFGNEHHHEFHSQYVIEVAKHLGTNIDACSWRQLESMENLEGYQVIEFNEQNLFSDSYLVHYPLRRGANLFVPAQLNGHAIPKQNYFDSNDSQSLKADEKLIRLSPYHGILVTETLTGISALENKGAGLTSAAAYMQKFEDAMMSEANKRYPWPLWFSQWSKAALSTNAD